MSRKPADAPPPRLIDIITAISIMAALVVLAGKSMETEGETRRYPPSVTRDAAARPISSEANVFRVRETELGIVPDFVVDSAAHVRSLDMYRRLRAYPGAPPRISHGLTDQEYRHVRCNVCHLRGGWVARFGTYAPLTPHPEYSSCLQCHLPQDALVGRTLPVTGAVSACPQCHVDPDLAPENFVTIDWEDATWPETGPGALPASPNRIPHDFQTRSNCLACHSGPGAVIELRTEHPERVNCRQCHVPAGGDIGSWPRQSDASDRRGEGDS